MLEGTHQAPPIDLHQFSCLFSKRRNPCVRPWGALWFAAAQLFQLEFVFEQK
jgi:hypothetical protein